MKSPNQLTEKRLVSPLIALRETEIPLGTAQRTLSLKKQSWIWKQPVGVSTQKKNCFK